MSVIKEEYLKKEITVHDLLPLSFLKKSVYTGSRDRLRYRMEKKEEGEEPDIHKYLLVTAWATPFAFDKTPEEDKCFEKFPFTNEGIIEAAAYLESLRKRIEEQ